MKVRQLIQKSSQELKALLTKKRKELVKVNLDLKMKKIKDVHQKKKMRHDIARILTILRERELTKEAKKK